MLSVSFFAFRSVSVWLDGGNRSRLTVMSTQTARNDKNMTVENTGVVSGHWSLVSGH